MLRQSVGAFVSVPLIRVRFAVGSYAAAGLRTAFTALDRSARHLRSGVLAKPPTQLLDGVRHS
jgi:hypothetical protein